MWGSMCMRPCMDALKYVQVIVGWQIPRDTISFLLILKLPKSNTLVWSGTCLVKHVQKLHFFFFFSALNL